MSSIFAIEIKSTAEKNWHHTVTLNLSTIVLQTNELVSHFNKQYNETNENDIQSKTKKAQTQGP